GRRRRPRRRRGQRIYACSVQLLEAVAIRGEGHRGRLRGSPCPEWHPAAWCAPPDRHNVVHLHVWGSSHVVRTCTPGGATGTAATHRVGYGRPTEPPPGPAHRGAPGPAPPAAAARNGDPLPTTPRTPP